MSITEERDETIDFTQPYVPPAPSVYLAVVGAGDGVVAGTVAAQASTVHSEYLAGGGQDAGGVRAPVRPSSTPSRSGEVNAALVDLAFARESVGASGGVLAIVGPAWRWTPVSASACAREMRSEREARTRPRLHEGGRIAEPAHPAVAWLGGRALLIGVPPSAGRASCIWASRPECAGCPSREAVLATPATYTGPVAGLAPSAIFRALRCESAHPSRRWWRTRSRQATTYRNKAL